MNRSDKKRTRLLRAIARKSASELETLRQIPDTPDAMAYFYRIMESVFIENSPYPGIDSGALPESSYTTSSGGSSRPYASSKIVVTPSSDTEPAAPLNTDVSHRPRIGVYCMMVPEELIYAAGAVPVRLCAGCHESTSIGEDRVPRDGCPLVKSSMGMTMQDGLNLFDSCDVVIIPTTCDAKRKLGEELSAYKEVWMMEVPHIKTSDFSRKMWLDQVYALKNRLEKMGINGKRKKSIKSKALARAITQSATAQARIRELSDIRALPRPVIWGRQAMAVVNSFAYAPIREWTAALTQLNQELTAAVDGSQWILDEKAPRIHIAGSPFIFPNMKILSLVEEMGGIVVSDESCAGDRWLKDPVGATEDNLRNQVTALASRYLSPCVCPSFTPNDDRLIAMERSVDRSRVDGVLYHVLKGCVIYDFEVHRVEKVLKERGIPLLRVETDYSPEDVEQLRTRIEAFIEMLKTRKMKKGIFYPMTAYYIGIDAGSTYVKVALMDENKTLVGHAHRYTGIDPDGTSKKMIEALLEANGSRPDQIKVVMATGYSRRNIQSAHDTITEIKAHAAGALWAAPDGVEIRTVIDIGGQDSKVIVLNGDGDIENFAMNDKCAAGTGRFLESLARVLELELDQLGPISLESQTPLSINSTCVVFAESEVISLVARKEKRTDIVAGIHASLAKRIAAMARKAGISPEILLTGGGGLNAGIAQALDDELLMDIHVPEFPQLNGAIGAALVGKSG